MKNKDINLLLVYRQVIKRKANKNAMVYVYGMLVIGAVLISLSLYGVMLYENSVVVHDVELIQQYLNSPQVIERSNEFAQLTQEIKDLEVIISELESARIAFDFIPRPGSRVFNRVLAERPGSVRIDEIRFGDGQIMLSVTATRVYSISDYVLRLRRTEYFQDVRYRGYALEDGNYSSQISVILKGEN